MITTPQPDHKFTYAEDDVSSGNVILRMAHGALAEQARVRAHGRTHDRQKLASRVVNRGESPKKGGGIRRREGGKIGDSWEEGEMGYTC